MLLLYAIDRFEGDKWVVLEDDAAHTFSVPAAWLPDGAHEGDVVSVHFERSEQPAGATVLRIELVPDARADRLRDAERRRQELPRGPKGDVSL
jgi:hypothetical protein